MSFKETRGCHEILPPELLCPILAFLPDLESLDNYLRASPAAYRAFSDKAVSATIFEAILASDTTTHIYSTALIRIIALIRAGSLPPAVRTYEIFETFVEHEATPRRHDTIPTPTWEKHWDRPSITLPLHTSPSILRGILITNRKIQRLAVGCLDFYLARFKALRPFHSAGFLHDNIYAHIEEYEFHLSPWAKKLDNVQLFYQVQNIGPLSWLEQQRVIRAFWRIQLADDIKAEMLALHIVWIVKDAIVYSEDEEQDQEEWEGEGGEEDVQMKPEWVRAEDLCCMSSSSKLETVKHLGTIEDELLKSVLDYTGEMPEMMSEARYLALKKEYAGVRAPGTVDDIFHLNETSTSDTWFLFYKLVGAPGAYNYYDTNPPPLQGVEFKLFRRLGFAIWGNARMVAYGLLDPKKVNPVGSLPPYWEAWKSLLSESDELEREKEIERRLVQFLESERRTYFPHMEFEAFRKQWNP